MRYGAAINVFSSAVVFINNSFANNERNLDSLSIQFGPGAIYAQDSSLHFNAITMFLNNSANASCGGALQARNTTVALSGDIKFVNNSAKFGGAISVLQSVLYFNGNVGFESCYC